MTRRRLLRPVGGGLTALATAVGVLAVVSLARLLTVDSSALQMREILMLAAFGVTIAVAELARVPLGEGREAAPASTAVALALAMTFEVSGAWAIRIGSDATIGTTAAAMAIGFAATRFAARAGSGQDLAIRFLAAALASLLYRTIPLWQGQTLLALQPSWQSQRWASALSMAAVSTVVLVFQSLLTATASALDGRRLWRVALLDEARRVAGLSTALAATGVLIALAEPSLGMLAIPIFLMPLLLAQIAVRRFFGSQTTYGETIRTLSRLTELGGYTPVDHPDRVAELSVEMARVIGMSERDLRDLEYAALLHDIGQVALRTPIPGGATMLAAPVDQDRIARDGAQIVRRTGVLDRVAEILEAQAKPYRHVRELGEVVPLSSRIVKVANAYDDLAGDRPTDGSRDTAIERIHLGLGYEYDPAVVDALERVLEDRSRAGGTL